MHLEREKPVLTIEEGILIGGFLVDVRTPAEFAAGSVPGAVNIPLMIIPFHLQEFQDRGAVILFCHSGGRSEHAKMFLEGKGIKNVFNAGSLQMAAQLVASIHHKNQVR